MRPGEQILTAVYLDLLPRERGVDHGLLYVPPAYLPTYQASEYSLISPMYACLPTSLRPDLRGGTPGPISPRAQASNKRTWRYAARCAALPCPALQPQVQLQCYSPKVLTSRILTDY